ncbi:MAG: aminoglycoside phosphotransferase family protein [Acidimicrobiia bacterium]|nr:aminoglycoside phosphotransferase family protein [Acidimicrobiia bacterium]
MTDRAVASLVEDAVGRTVERVVRIGQDHGFSGRVFRVHLADGTTAVAKTDAPAVIAGEMRARRRVGDLLGPSIPRALGAATEGDLGVIVMADVTPARQGDWIDGCGAEDLAAVLAVLGRLHGGTLVDEPWTMEPWPRERWHARVRGAAERFPALFGGDVRIWLLDEYPLRFAASVERLAAGPIATIHGDAHLDNVLWRPDGSAVLLDWNHHRPAPPALDLASLLPDRPLTDPGPYREAFGGPEADTVVDLLGDARVVSIRGIVGWAARDDVPIDHRRSIASRDRAAEQVSGLIARLRR